MFLWEELYVSNLCYQNYYVILFWNKIMNMHAIFLLAFVGKNIHIFMWEKIACCVRLHWERLLV